MYLWLFTLYPLNVLWFILDCSNSIYLILLLTFHYYMTFSILLFFFSFMFCSIFYQLWFLFKLIHLFYSSYIFPGIFYSILFHFLIYYTLTNYFYFIFLCYIFIFYYFYFPLYLFCDVHIVYMQCSIIYFMMFT